jgi:hypothetical protein
MCSVRRTITGFAGENSRAMAIRKCTSMDTSEHRQSAWAAFAATDRLHLDKNAQRKSIQSASLFHNS